MKIIKTKLASCMLIFVIGILCSVPAYSQKLPEPKGLMLNLDFQSVKDGLIPSKTLYPLYVPQGELDIERFNSRNMLSFQFGQGLDIPHSSLLNPNGHEWIISVRAFPLTDGLIASQGNDQHGYVIYMKDGHICATVRTGYSVFTLQEREDYRRTKYVKRWVTIELRIKQGSAILSLNRNRVALKQSEPALRGENLRIRLGNHNTLPSPLKNIPGMQPTGFTGSINSLKIFRN